tara:strand:- start:84 stop:473 length:390 start_codon:yes stop_codon:yes gene_type:complete
MLTTATFELNEMYHSGNTHTTSTQEDAELAQIVKEALEAGGVGVYTLTMTTLSVLGNLVQWHVAVTLPTNQVTTLGARHASPAFVAGIEAGAYALGGTHTHSLYQTQGAVDASAAPVLGMAPSPPPLQP